MTELPSELWAVIFEHGDFDKSTLTSLARIRFLSPLAELSLYEEPRIVVTGRMSTHKSLDKKAVEEELIHLPWDCQLTTESNQLVRTLTTNTRIAKIPTKLKIHLQGLYTKGAAESVLFHLLSCLENVIDLGFSHIFPSDLAMIAEILNAFRPEENPLRELSIGCGGTGSLANIVDFFRAIPQVKELKYHVCIDAGDLTAKPSLPPTFRLRVLNMRFDTTSKDFSWLTQNSHSTLEELVLAECHSSLDFSVFPRLTQLRILILIYENKQKFDQLVSNFAQSLRTCGSLKELCLELLASPVAPHPLAYDSDATFIFEDLPMTLNALSLDMDFRVDSLAHRLKDHQWLPCIKKLKLRDDVFTRRTVDPDVALLEQICLTRNIRLLGGAQEASSK